MMNSQSKSEETATPNVSYCVEFAFSLDYSLKHLHPKALPFRGSWINTDRHQLHSPSWKMKPIQISEFPCELALFIPRPHLLCFPPGQLSTNAQPPYVPHLTPPTQKKWNMEGKTDALTKSVQFQVLPESPGISNFINRVRNACASRTVKYI